MHGQIVLAFGISHLDDLVTQGERAAVTHLTTHLGIERSAVEHDLIEGFVLLCHLAVAQDVDVTLAEVIAHKLGHAILELHPVGSLDSSGIARTLFLLLHLDVELLLVDGHAVLAQDELGQVQRETKRVIEGESFLTVNHGLSGALGVGNHLLDEFHSRFQGAQEGIFLFLGDMLDQVGLGLDLGVSLAHALDEGVDEAVHEGLLETEEGVAIAHGTAQDATDHITGLGIAGQLAVGYRESDGAHMVGNNAHGDINVLVVAVFLAAHLTQLADERLEHVGIIVGFLALQGHAQALQSHTRVNHLVGQGFEATVNLAVILHEHEVPNLDDQGMILVDKRSSWHSGFFFFTAQVDVNLTARATGTRIAHFPEVVVGIAVEDVILRQMGLPELGSLVIAAHSDGIVALKDSGVQVLGVQFVHIDQQIPSPVDRLVLEVVAKRPIAQHLKHRVMVGVMAHFLQVIVLAAHAEALLRVGGAAPLRFFVAQDNVLELVHTSVGKHEGWIVLNHHGS